MYFSMHALRHCCSFPLSELPGAGTQWSKHVLLTWEMSCLALAMLDCVEIALMSRPFMALDSELEKELGVGAPLGKEVDTSGVLVVEEEEESLPLLLPPPKKPPKDMVGWVDW